jgi:hypothetical protein
VIPKKTTLVSSLPSPSPFMTIKLQLPHRDLDKYTHWVIDHRIYIIGGTYNSNTSVVENDRCYVLDTSSAAAAAAAAITAATPTSTSLPSLAQATKRWQWKEITSSCRHSILLIRVGIHVNFFR